MAQQEEDSRTGRPAGVRDNGQARSGRLRLGIRGRIFLGLGAIMIAFAALNALVVVMEMNKAREKAVFEAVDMTRLLGLSLSRQQGTTPAGALARNPAAFREFVGEFSQLMMRRVIVFDPKGRLLADSNSERRDSAAGPDEGRAIAAAIADRKPRVFKPAGGGDPHNGEWIAVPLRVPSGAATGAAILDFSTLLREHKARIMKNLIPLLLADAVAVVLLGFAARAFSRSLTTPIRRLTKAAFRLGQGDLNEPVNIPRRDEIGILAASFEKMRQDLRRSTLGSKTRIDEQIRVEEALQGAHAELTHQLAELKRYADEMKHLSWMGEALQKALTPEECYASLAPIVPKLFPDHSGGLFLFGATHIEVKPVCLWGDLPPNEKDLARLDLMALGSGHSYATFLPQEEPKPGAPDTSFKSNGSLCVPLAAKGDVLGFLYLRPSGSSPADQAPPPASTHYLALTVADQIALTLSNLNLRETLRQQSIRDPLTGLFNRRYLDETMEREILRAKRLDSPVGVILIDIDHFKMFNDTHGHEAGDAALKDLGTLFRRAIRGSDIACRYGGDEFLLILPDAGLEDSRQRSENIRGAVEQRVIEHQKKNYGRMTVSMGVASFPNQGRTSTEVILAADAALYRAKKEGRNRVVTAPLPGREKP